MCYQVLAPASVNPQLGQTSCSKPLYSIFASLHRGQNMPALSPTLGLTQQTSGCISCGVSGVSGCCSLFVTAGIIFQC